MQTDLLSSSRALQFFFFCWRFQPPQFLVAQLLHRGGKIWRVGFWKREQTAVEVGGGVAVVMCREVSAELSSSTGQPWFHSQVMRVCVCVCVRTRTLLNWQHSCGNSCLPLLSWTSESQEQNWLIILHFGRMEFTDSGSQLICITQWCFYILLWTKKVNSWVIKIRSLYNPNCLELQWFGWGDPWKTLTFCILVNKCTVLTPVKWVSKDIVWLDKLNLILWGSDIL